MAHFLVPASMVRDLEYVDPQPRPRLHEGLLCLGLLITGEQDPDVVHLGHQHDRGVVRVVAENDTARRADDLQGHLAHPPYFTQRGHEPLPPSRLEAGSVAFRGPWYGTDKHFPHATTHHSPGPASDLVG